MESTEITQPEGYLSMVEKWFEDLGCPAKLAACLLHRLLMADSKNLSGVGQTVFEKLEVDMIVTQDLTSECDTNIRKLYFLVKEVCPIE